jgi:hypothetical protein
MGVQREPVNGWNGMTVKWISCCCQRGIPNLEIASGRSHLDPKKKNYHDAPVRTTVTLDPDVEQLLRQAMHASGQNLKDALNDGLRRGLAHLAPATSAPPFVVKARPLGLRAGLIRRGRTMSLVDREVEAFAAVTRRLGKS